MIFAFLAPPDGLVNIEILLIVVYHRGDAISTFVCLGILPVRLLASGMSLSVNILDVLNSLAYHLPTFRKIS